MVEAPTAIDESWSRADWDVLRRRGVSYVSLYLSRDPSKNAKPADIRAGHARGIGIGLNWEHQAGAPLNGRRQGLLDAGDWCDQRNALIKAVGYAPKNKLGAIFSCDRDTSSSQYPAIDAYYAATKSVVEARNARNGVYGEADLIEHLHRKGLTEIEWQTYAWSQGRLSPEADLYQYLNGQKIGTASVDFNRIIRTATLGAWWPPGHHLDSTTSPGTTNEGLDMTEAQLLAALTKWAKSAGGKRAISDAILTRKLATKDSNGVVRETTFASWVTHGNLKAEAAVLAINAMSAVVKRGLTVAFDPKTAAQAVLTSFKNSLGGTQ